MEFKRTLALDSDGDILLDETNQLVWLEGPAAVEQELKVALKTVRGEDPFNQDFGLQIFEVAGSPQEILRREIRDTLLRDDRVGSVDNINIEEDPEVSRGVDVTVAVSLVDETSLSIEEVV